MPGPKGNTLVEDLEAVRKAQPGTRAASAFALRKRLGRTPTEVEIQEVERAIFKVRKKKKKKKTII